MYDRISELWRDAQRGLVPWEAVRKRIGCYIETASVMHNTEQIAEMLFLLQITIAYQIIKWEKRRKLQLVR